MLVLTVFLHPLGPGSNVSSDTSVNLSILECECYQSLAVTHCSPEVEVEDALVRFVLTVDNRRHTHPHREKHFLLFGDGETP